MNVRGLAVAMVCAAVPLALSCAQSEDVTFSGAVASGGIGSTGGSATVGTGGSTDGISATGGDSGIGVATGGTTAPATGGSSGQGPAGGAGQATGGGSASGAATGGSSTGGSASGPATGGASTGGAPMTGAGGTRSSTGGGTGGGTGGTTGGATGGMTGGATGGKGSGGAATGGTSAGTGGHATGGSGGGAPAAAAGAIVPLYTDPTDPSWDAIVTAALAHPTVQVVAIVNPSDGPGPNKDQDYVTGIASLLAANIKVIGYVATGYGSHSIASMEAEIDTWKSFYPQVQGIFFDEQSNDPTYVSHYQTLSQYAKSKGLSYTVGNPGTDVPTSYIGALDTMLVYESDGLPTISSLKAWSAYAPTNFGIIPYKVPSLDATFVKQARQYIHYVYLQKDDLPNPWDSLTPYFADLLAALE